MWNCLLQFLVTNGDFLGTHSFLPESLALVYWSVRTTQRVPSLPLHIKLPVQVFIGALIIVQFFPVLNEITLFNYQIPDTRWLIMVVFLFWFLGMVNAVNLIDGLDGLAGGVAFLIVFTCAVAGYFLGGPAFMHLNIILCAALLAFLHFNLQPSHFFMGDSGSLFLGYHMAVMPIFIFVSQGSTTSSLDLTPFILMCSFLIADTARVSADL